MGITDWTEGKDRLTNKKEWFGREAGGVGSVGVLEETAIATVTREGEENTKGPGNGC